MLKPVKFIVLIATLTLFAGPVMAFPGGSAAQPGMAPAGASSGTTIKGTVVETMDAGGYTYACLEHDGQKTWAAMPQTALKVGEEIEIRKGMEMNNFTSKSLGRTFESINFSQGVVQR